MSTITAPASSPGPAASCRRSCLTNHDLAKIVDTSDEWIIQRTGIKERRIAGPDESTATLAAHAAKRALEAAGLAPEDLDLIVCGTISPEMTFPSTACFVAAALGLTSTPAFDIAAACSGFIYTLETASSFIKAGQHIETSLQSELKLSAV